jgi:hypothetical protein
MNNCLNLRRLTVFTLFVFLLTTFIPVYRPCTAADFLSSYQILKQDYSEMVDCIIAGGASESDIEAFLIDLEDTVKGYGTLTEENFDSQMYQSFEEVILWRKHRTFFNALLSSYGDEIDYTRENGELHPSLLPIHDAIMEALLGGNEDDPEDEEDEQHNSGPSSGGGSSPGQKNDQEQPQPAQDTTPAPVPVISPFTDIIGHWAEDPINQACQKGLAAGMTPSQFGPQIPITRAQFATLMLRALGQTPGSYNSSRFDDVPLTAWYCNAVNQAAELGIIDGYSQTQFGPEDPITREQISVIISRALLLKEKGVAVSENQILLILSAVADQDQISHWAKSGVAFSLTNGIMTGRDLGSFVPAQHATRAEATVVILKVYQLLNEM